MANGGYYLAYSRRLTSMESIVRNFDGDSKDYKY